MRNCRTGLCSVCRRLSVHTQGSGQPLLAGFVREVCFNWSTAIVAAPIQ